jgi:hypothetical protein
MGSTVTEQPAAGPRILLLLIAFAVSSPGQLDSAGDSTSTPASHAIAPPTDSAGGVSKKKEKKRKVKLRVQVGLRGEYNSNVFRLTDEQRALYDENDPGDAASGRYDDMDYPSDYVISPWIECVARLRSPFGGRLTLSPKLRYNLFARNRKNRRFDGRIDLAQTVAKRAVIKLTESMDLNHFRKNYLSAVSPQGTSDNINRAERTYSNGRFNEFETSLEFTYQLLSFKKREFGKPGVTLELQGGNRLRRFDDVFENRSLTVWKAGAGAGVKPYGDLSLSAGYVFEHVSSPGKDELTLVDETVNGFNRDVTGDFRIGDDAMLVTAVDRSRYQHLLKAECGYELAQKLEFSGGVRLRRLRYNTENVLDQEHHNQMERRLQCDAGLTWDIARFLAATAKYSYTTDSSRDGVFSQHEALLELEYTFLSLK